MFAYFKRHESDIEQDVIAVKIEGARWNDAPALRGCTRVQSTDRLRSLRRSKAIRSYYVSGLTLCAYYEVDEDQS